MMEMRDNGINEGQSKGVNVDKFGHGAPNSCPNKCKTHIRAISGHKFRDVTLDVDNKFGDATLDISHKYGL